MSDNPPTAPPISQPELIPLKPIRTPLSQTINSIGPIAVTAAIILTFDISLLIAWSRNDADTLKLMMSSLINLLTLAAGYWIGSSAGSARKTDLMTPSA